MLSYYAQGAADYITAGAVEYVGTDEIRDAFPAVDMSGPMVELVTSRQFEAIPESNQKTLTAGQRAGALWIGGEWKHYLTRVT